MQYDAGLYPLQGETRTIIGIGMDVHNHLGPGFLEIVYKDALEYEFRERGIVFVREKEYPVRYKNIELPHRFFADFVVFDSVILEVKAQKELADVHYSQVINYLAVSGCRVGLLLNFGSGSLKYKRIVY